MKSFPRVLGLLTLVACQAGAAIATLTPSADTTISEDNAAKADGVTGHMIVGHLDPFHANVMARGLLRFDLSSIPGNATVSSVALRLAVIASASAGNDTHVLNALSRDWDEATASWVSTGWESWEEGGGDFDPTADRSVSVGGIGEVIFASTPSLIARVQGWIVNPSENHGWMLRSLSEVGDRNARRFATRDAATDQPLLTVEYTVPPQADFNVTSPGSFFQINGQNPNPTLTLTRGSNYTFAINTDPSHPFEIVTNLAGEPYTNGLSTNNISSGLITFAVPTNAPDTLYYICSVHFFSGTIQIVDPPPPPPPPDFFVVTPGGYYTFNGGDPNQTLTLTRGITYVFAIDADPSHPLLIASDWFGTPWDEGVVNNNISNGRLTFTVPFTAPDLLFYVCSIHLFGGEINVIDPPAPPLLVKIVSLNVTDSNVLVRSLGTNGNGWTVIPEYSSNLLSSNWTAVPAFSNAFLNGTNVTGFGRLDPICGPNVFLRMKNVKN
jgi:hypothetical protein